MSLLALWHPAGPGASRMELCEAAARCDTPLDVAIVVAPARARHAELAAEVAAAARRLPGDGLAWVVAGRRQRGGAERAVRDAGLVVAERVLLIGGWPDTAHLVPLAPAALRDAGVRHLGLSPRRARVLARLCRGRAGRLALSRMAPGCGLVAVRPSGIGPLCWLGAIDGAAVGTATLSQSTQRDARVAVALRFAPGSAAPDLAVKLALDAAGAARVDAERHALLELGPAARAAGAAVPFPRQAPGAVTGPGSAEATGRAMLVTGALAGSPASALLRRASDRLTPVLRAVSDWLLAWNRATAATATVSAALIERRLLGPAARVAESIPALAPHAAAMRALAARLTGEPLATVAVHDDLTMSNVLLGPDGLAIVDWEAARPDDLPLLDLWYALADGLARARGVEHARAVEILCDAAPGDAPVLAGLPAEHAAALGLSADQARLGFHACWLCHADDELRRGTRGPFVAVVEALAARRAPR